MDINEVIVKDLLHAIANAGNIIIYGASQKAKEIIPVCETFLASDKIKVVVTQSTGGVIEGYQILSVQDVSIDQEDIVLVATNECYFDEIKQMLQLQRAGKVICLNSRIIRETRVHVLRENLKKLGIDVRLFERMEPYELSSQCLLDLSGDIAAKTWELATEDTARYVIENMSITKSFQSRDEYHDWLKTIIQKTQTEQGINFEFGVADGRSLRILAGEGMNKFYGFDSFEGLPDTWIPEVEKGTFKVEKLPCVPDNVELVKGWFDDTLPIFVTRDDIVGKKADFIHIDCDLYSSTKTVFDYLAPLIQSGTIIAFDEYFNYPGWQMHEFKAFHEFIYSRNLEYEYLAYVNKWAQACVRIL